MSYRRNCSRVASSPRRRYVSGVRFAALWKHWRVRVPGKIRLRRERKGRASRRRHPELSARVNATELLPPGHQKAVNNQSKQSVDGCLVVGSILRWGSTDVGSGRQTQPLVSVL